MAARPVAEHFVAMQYDEQFGTHMDSFLRDLLDFDAMVERGMNTMGLASGRNGRSPLGSPNPAMLWMGRFCNSRPLPLSTMLYLKSIALSLEGGKDLPAGPG